MKEFKKQTEKFCKVLLILMFSISQFSFPLEVLAEESNEVKPVQEDLTENKDVTKTEEEDSKESEEESTEEKISDEMAEESTQPEEDFTEVGKENLEEEKDSTEVEGEENDSEEEESNILFTYTELKYVNGAYYVPGGKGYLTVEEVLSNFDTINLENDLSLNLVITDLEDGILEGTANVLNNYKLVLTDVDQTIIETHLIKIEGDYTEDSLVNEEDAKVLVDKILNNETNDLNEGNEFNILDATNPVFITGSWENNLENQDTLTNSLENKDEINKGEELIVKYYINGFEYDSLTGIQGKVNYNKELLELQNIEIDSLHGNFNGEGKFAYLLDNYQSNDILMTLTFKAISAGEAVVSIDEIMASTGILADLDGESISTTVTIFNYGTGGDVEEEDTSTQTPETSENIESSTQSEATVETTTVVPTVSTVTTSTTIKKVTLSSDNLIKSLTIKGYDIEFDPNIYEYSIKVKNSVKSLKLTIELNDEKASYVVNGNKNFKVGENTVTITVTAEDGSEKTYTIKVDREEKEETTEEEEIEETSSSKTIIIILIVLVIIGLIYVIFKDDEEDSKESKK